MLHSSVTEGQYVFCAVYFEHLHIDIDFMSPSISTQVVLVFASLSTIADMVRDIPSCYCMLLMPPS